MNQQAYSQTMLLVHILETSKDDPVSALEKIKNEIYGRITFMDENGKVLYDSDYDIAQMESHADRKEIVAAIMDGIGTHQRFSATANRIMYYCAARVPDMGVIRVGVMSANLASDSIASTTPAIWIGAVIFVIDSDTLYHDLSKKDTARQALDIDFALFANFIPSTI